MLDLKHPLRRYAISYDIILEVYYIFIRTKSRKVNSMNAKNINSSQLELLIFSAEACSVCHAVKPRLLTLTDKYQIPYRIIDTQQELEFASQMLVFTVPTVLLMLEGREIRRESRFIDFSGLEKTMSAAAESI